MFSNSPDSEGPCHHFGPSKSKNDLSLTENNFASERTLLIG